MQHERKKFELNSFNNCEQSSRSVEDTKCSFWGTGPTPNRPLKRVEERTRLREPRFTASKFLGPRIYRFGHGGHVRIPAERRFRPLTAASCQKGIPFNKLKRKEEGAV